jgi:HEPN domain-containing protein
MKSQYHKWFLKGDEDALSAESILRHLDGAPSTVCFLAQQVGEKYLKGLLAFHNKNIQKVHDLLQLETLLLQIEPEIQNVHKDLLELNRFYIETRYPGDYPEFSWEEASSAYESAKRVKEFVVAKTQ